MFEQISFNESKVTVDKKFDASRYNVLPVDQTLKHSFRSNLPPIDQVFRHSFGKWNVDVHTPLKLKLLQFHSKLHSFKNETTATFSSILKDSYSLLLSSTFEFYTDKVLVLEDQLNDSYINKLILSKRKILNSKMLQDMQRNRIEIHTSHLFLAKKSFDFMTPSSNFIQSLCRLTSRQNVPHIFLSSEEIELGETLIPSILVPLPQHPFDKFQIALRTWFGKHPLIVLKFGEEYFPLFCTKKDKNFELYHSFIPSTPLDHPRSEQLTIEIRDGKHAIYEKSILIKNKDYPIESIWLSDEKASLKPTLKEKEEMNDFLQLKTQTQYWNRPFLTPCNGEVTTGYGLKRYYNGVFAEKYYHRGVDYGAWTGEPVISPADGRIALIGRESDGYEFHGNCIGIDHGHGVQSMLMHLDSMAVREGDVVRAGQVIGCVGETGIATGPHLHWGLYVNGKCVNPKDWMN